jgi:hypothetical protein
VGSSLLGETLMLAGGYWDVSGDKEVEVRLDV